MAKIEDLITRIPDDKLHDEPAAEAREVKKHTERGLLFEEHLPKMLRLSKVLIGFGSLVVHRDAAGNDLWHVISIGRKKATCRQPINPVGGSVLFRDAAKAKAGE